jgi:hypothetical protein
MYNLTLTLTDEQHLRAEAKAHELGYQNPDEYLHAVIDELLDDDPPTDVVTAVREALADIRAGRTYPASELRRLLESDDGERR